MKKERNKENRRTERECLGRKRKTEKECWGLQEREKENDWTEK